MSERTDASLLDTLLDRLEGQESLELEFKGAQHGLPSSLWPTVSAFANTSGGWIVLGVVEEDGEPTLRGVANAPALLQTIYDSLRNPQKISYPVCGVGDVSIEHLDDKHVIVLRVPAAPRRTRPVYVNGNPYTGTYVRRHAGDYRCTKPEVDRMMREASDVAMDSAILRDFGWDDLDREAFARYRRRFQTLHPASPRNGYDDQRFLEALGGFRRSREADEAGLTVAGLLLFGTPEALREWRGRHLIDYRLVSGDDDLDDRWEDRLLWDGNLLGAFETIYPRLTDRLPVPFRLSGEIRVDESQIHVALREALVNLLVHADYAETQASLIKRFPDGYLLRNPGNSRVSEIDLLTGDRSDPRNPTLVFAFRLIGLAEEAGSGIPKIIRAWRELGLQLPDIDVGTERYEFTIKLRYAHLLAEEDRDWLRSLGEGWSEAEQLALVLARHDGSVDNLRLRRLTGQHPADVTKVLGGLRNRGFLQMIGGRRGARYELGPAAQGASGAGASEVTGRLAGAEPASGATVPTSGAGQLTSGGDGANSGGMEPEGTSPARQLEGLYPSLLEISRPARERRRLAPADRDDIIVRLCARVPLSLRELAHLVERDEEYLLTVLRRLVASGRLALLHPEQPTHPQQKYLGRGVEGQTSTDHIEGPG